MPGDAAEPFGAVRFNRGGGAGGRGFQPCGLVGPETLVEGTSAKDEYCEFFKSRVHAGLSSGVWRCTPCKERFVQPCDEVCFILSGRVVITALCADEEPRLGKVREGSAPQAFGTGDAFALHKGDRIEWHTVETVTKYYVVFEAEAGAQEGVGGAPSAAATSAASASAALAAAETSVEAEPPVATQPHAVSAGLAFGVAAVAMFALSRL